jgi:hypothetical protein
MEYELYKKVMAKESPPGVFLYISKEVVTALLLVLFFNEALCSIAPLIICRI